MSWAYDHTDALRSPMLDPWAGPSAAAIKAITDQVYCTPGSAGWQPRGIHIGLALAYEIDRI